MAPHKLSSGCGTGANRLAAGSRTVEMNSTVAEAPRPARDQWDGRSPGSRVSASCRLPDLSHADRNQWHQANARRLQLRGQPWIGIQAPARRWLCTTFPHRSLVRERPSNAASTTLRPRVVNGRLPAAARNPQGWPHLASLGLTAILLLSFPPPCITLPKVVRCSEPTAWGWRVKRESGECAQLARNSGTAPATVSESKAKLHVTAPRAWEDASPAPKAFASPETGLMSSSGYLRGGRIGLCAMRRRQSPAIGRPRQGGLGTLTQAHFDAGGTVGINVSAI
jgi:hypothetical protein